MIRGNVFFEVEKIEQLALINRLTTHHDLRPSLKGSDDGIMIRQYPRGLFQQHRPKADMQCSGLPVRVLCYGFGGSTGERVGQTPLRFRTLWVMRYAFSLPTIHARIERGA